MKYRSKCRFNFLIEVDGQIIEIRPNQEFETLSLINHPNIVLIEEDRQVNTIEAPKKNVSKKIV